MSTEYRTSATNKPSLQLTSEDLVDRLINQAAQQVDSNTDSNTDTANFEDHNYNTVDEPSPRKPTFQVLHFGDFSPNPSADRLNHIQADQHHHAFTMTDRTSQSPGPDTEHNETEIQDGRTSHFRRHSKGKLRSSQQSGTTSAGFDSGNADFPEPDELTEGKRGTTEGMRISSVPYDEIPISDLRKHTISPRNSTTHQPQQQNEGPVIGVPPSRISESRGRSEGWVRNSQQNGRASAGRGLKSSNNADITEHDERSKVERMGSKLVKDIEDRISKRCEPFRLLPLPADEMMRPSNQPGHSQRPRPCVGSNRRTKIVINAWRGGDSCEDVDVIPSHRVHCPCPCHCHHGHGRWGPARDHHRKCPHEKRRDKSFRDSCIQTEPRERQHRRSRRSRGRKTYNDSFAQTEHQTQHKRTQCRFEPAPCTRCEKARNTAYNTCHTQTGPVSYQSRETQCDRRDRLRERQRGTPVACHPFPFLRRSSSGNLIVSPSMISFEDEKVAILVADKCTTPVTHKRWLRRRNSAGQGHGHGQGPSVEDPPVLPTQDPSQTLRLWPTPSSRRGRDRDSQNSANYRRAWND